MPKYSESSVIDLQEKNRLLEEQNENLKSKITDLEFSILQLQDDLQEKSNTVEAKAHYVDPSVIEDYIQEQINHRVETALKVEYAKLEEHIQAFKKKENDFIKKQVIFYRNLTSLEKREETLKNKSATIFHKKTLPSKTATLASSQKPHAPIQSQDIAIETKKSPNPNPTEINLSDRDVSSLPNLFYCLGNHSFYSYKEATKINLTSSTAPLNESQQSVNKLGK